MKKYLQSLFLFLAILVSIGLVCFAWAASGPAPDFGSTATHQHRYNCNPTPGGTPTICVTPDAVNVSGGSVTAHLDNAGVSVLYVVATNKNGQGNLDTSAVTVYACPVSTQAVLPSQVYTYTATAGANPVTVIRYFNGIQDGSPVILQPQGSIVVDTEYNLTAGDVIEAYGNTLVTFTHTERESPL